MCETEELIVGYVYDELSTDERTELEQHLATCGACRVEIEELRATRGCLESWTPPQPDLGFRVIRGGSAPAPALPRRPRLVPAFAFAAAAVIVLAAAAAIANVEIRYGGDGMTVRTGWARTDVPGAARPDVALVSSPARPAPPAPADAAGAFAALDRRLREIETALSAPAQQPGGVRLASGQRMTDAEMLARVRQIVSDAEARQETAVAQLLLQVVRDFDQQRRADIALIQQGLGQYQGLTNAEIAQNREMVNQLVRAATTRQEK